MNVDLARKKHKDILKLIALYKEHPCLWDPTENGTNIHDRRIAFQRIAKEMNCTDFDVKSKMKNLRAQFRREVVRMKRLQTKRPKWVYFEPLIYLKPSIQFIEENSKKYNSRTSFDKNEISDNDDIDDGVLGLDENATTITSYDDESQQHETNDEMLDHTFYNNDELASETEPQETNNSHLDATENVIEKPMVVVSRQFSEERDEFTIFGEHVANELRQLEKHKKLQKILKCAILQSILNVNQANEDCSAEDVDYAEECYMEEYV